MRRPFVHALAPALLSSLAAVSAQSNQDPGIDVFLSKLDVMETFGRTGTYPNGTSGVSLRTTVCNTGTKPLTWRAAMNANHPLIAFLVVRDSNGRFEQISDRSFVKHGFFAAEGTGCGPCSPATGGQIGSMLGVGCSDTYDSATNSDRFYLGPADEIDPWTGTWTPRCSYFDRGDPAVPAPNDCDGRRSLTRTQLSVFDPVSNRIAIDDAALDVPGARYFAQANFVVKGEPESVRFDSLGSRRFVPEWDGGTWNFTRSGAMRPGSVLNRWFGATVTSAVNDSSGVATDGRIYIALKVTGPVRGLYHYEYAVHNRDNASGVDEIRIPKCSGARIFKLGSRDIDADPNNDWTGRVDANEVVFSGTANTLHWNTIYNFWFDSDAAPIPGTIGLETFDTTNANPSFELVGGVPGALHNVYLDPGCAAGTAPELYATGTPARATLGNSSFALESIHNRPGRPNLLYVRLGDSSRNPLGCMLSDLGEQHPFSGVLADANGVAVHPAPIPASPQLEGLSVSFQSLGWSPGQGERPRDYALSNGLLIRIGDTLPDCP